MKKLAVAFAIAFLAPASLHAETMPDQLVRTTVSKIVPLLRVEGDPDDPRRLYALMDFCEEVLSHIDFRAMSRFAMGRAWNEATESQRARFTHEFRNLLVRTYGAALRNAGGQEVIYLPFFGKPGDKTAVVRTEVKPAGGAPKIAIHYSFYKARTLWNLYDIAIDGVSLVTTYRSVYAETIQKEGIDALIASIAQSNKEPPGSKPAPKPAGAPAKDGKK